MTVLQLILVITAGVLVLSLSLLYAAGVEARFPPIGTYPRATAAVAGFCAITAYLTAVICTAKLH